MEGEVLSEDELLMKLRDSRCRFQRRMQQLIEKYNQPFEDGPVIQMSTLTYQTPQGLRIWGGGLVKRSTGHMQGSPVKMDGRTDGSVRVPAGDLELPPPDTPADDSKSSDADTTFFQGEVIAGNLMSYCQKLLQTESVRTHGLFFNSHIGIYSPFSTHVQPGGAPSTLALDPLTCPQGF
ncbi:hypothetical protein E5288_WYG006251 [Bos mutus]|uniref:Holliday junction recognition protein n=1 Tax=Bos mutus TaxID=72004 RepID=A0A6B0QVS0_9CETA|nr:hypothetical protein [Bos mutus]